MAKWVLTNVALDAGGSQCLGLVACALTRHSRSDDHFRQR